MNKIKNTFRVGFAVAAGLVAMYSCTDTWNDHYDTAATLNFNGTTMEALEANASDFAKVVKAYGYDRELTSDNVYTIWAPANGSFDLSEYLDANGKVYADSADIVKEFIQNHIARYAISLNSQDQNFSLINEKKGSFTADGKFGITNVINGKSNISCKNGVIHLIDAASPYSYNLFELIAKQYKDDTDTGKDTLSLYAFLYDSENNQDSLIENKSVSRGVDENGDKIWVDSFVMRNNTVLKNVDAKLYEEDSAFIAIIPTAKAWAERYKIAESLLKFNPSEDLRSAGACDSLLRHYANHFAMTDLFYNKNANEHWQDSLKSTLYRGMPWYEHVYYSKMPKDLPEDTELNDILAKSGTPIACSNGEGYIVDEYPISVTEQFFKKIKVSANSRSINVDLDKNGKDLFTKNVNKSFRQYSGIYTELLIDTTDNTVIGRKSTNYSYTDIVPSTKSVNPNIGFDIPNTLSGTYDLYLVTCPYWLITDYVNIADSLWDARPYRFYTYVFERDNDGKNIGEYPASGERLTNPLTGENYFETRGLVRDDEGFLVINDTTYLGSYTFKNAYYGRNDEGVIIQLQTYITSKQTEQYSREMLISSIILKPRDEFGEAIEIPVAEETKMRKGTKLTTSNTSK
ncbi:MAG: fasciclin domain-containing protein [Bacteroidaceae bacterium]|nr:fasciclin domain-containing protein [Bacteroidaceae bacterium]